MSYGDMTIDEIKLNRLLNEREFIDAHLHMYPALKNDKKLQAIRQAVMTDVEELKKRIIEQVKKRKAEEAIQGVPVEENAEEKENVTSAKVNLEDELEKIRKEKAELEKLKRSLKGVVAASDGTRVIQVDREIFNCPVCKSVLRVKSGNDVCVNCGIHFTQ